eukprot:7450598-Pyramimonas_sp.AAC.1
MHIIADHCAAHPTVRPVMVSARPPECSHRRRGAVYDEYTGGVSMQLDLPPASHSSSESSSQQQASRSPNVMGLPGGSATRPRATEYRIIRPSGSDSA